MLSSATSTRTSPLSARGVRPRSGCTVRGAKRVTRKPRSHRRCSRRHDHAHSRPSPAHRSNWLGRTTGFSRNTLKPASEERSAPPNAGFRTSASPARCSRAPDRLDADGRARAHPCPGIRKSSSATSNGPAFVSRAPASTSSARLRRSSRTLVRDAARRELLAHQLPVDARDRRRPARACRPRPCSARRSRRAIDLRRRCRQA